VSFLCPWIFTVPGEAAETVPAWGST
jgi:hypothetical protein